MFHVAAAFCFVGGSVAAGILNVLAIRSERPSDAAALLRLIKLTLPVIYAYAKAQGNADETDFWRRTMAERHQSELDLTHAIHLIDKHQAIAATLTRARHFADQACAALEVFPESAMRRALIDLAEFCISRAY